MSREIKFRAWHKIDGMTTPWLTIEDGNTCQSMNGKPTCIMQYTGLKDKNGVDIYEGDYIVVTENKKPYGQGVVRFTDGGFQCNDLHLQYISSGGLDIEVIGNIYENPELLER